MCCKEDNLFLAVIEGTQMKVCSECANFGKRLGPVQEAEQRKAPIVPEKEILEVIVPDFPQRIRQAREGLGLKQGELAKKLNLKESLIQKVENGNMEPSIVLARKMEGFLRINLVEQHEEVHHKAQDQPKMGGFTLGDFMKKR